MAEFVHEKLEGQLEELEQLVRIKLFKRAEIGLIVQKRKRFEYKVNRRRRTKEDYLRFIQFEYNLLLLVRCRRSRQENFYKLSETDGKIMNRLHSLFKAALFRNQGDVKLWRSYISFCKKMVQHKHVSRMYKRMLQVHGRLTEVWCEAAAYEEQEVGTATTARKVYLAGLRTNSTSAELWTGYLDFELRQCREAVTLKERLEAAGVTEAETTIASGEIARVVLSNALSSHSPLPQFKRKLLSLWRRGCPESLRAGAFQVLADLGSTPEIAALLCEKPLQSLSGCTEATLADCFQLYDSTPGTAPYCVDLCIELLREEQDLKVTRLASERLQALLSAPTLPLDTCLDAAAALLPIDPAAALRIWAARAISDSPRLYTEWLTASSARESVFVLQSAAKNLTDERVVQKLLVTFLEGAAAQLLETELESFYEEFSARRECKEVCLRYLGWAHRVGGPAKGAEVFAKLYSRKPVPAELVLLYVTQLECDESAQSVAKQRQLLNRLIADQGNKCVEVWLTAMSLERRLGRGAAAASLASRAHTTLDPGLRQAYADGYHEKFIREQSS